jgi:O-antigen ligase
MQLVEINITRYLRKGLIDKALDVLLVPAISFILIARSWNIPCLPSLLTALALIYTVKILFNREYELPRLSLTWLDFSLIVLMLVECGNFLASTYKPNTFYYLADVLFLFVFYNLVKFNLKHTYQLTGIFIIVSIFSFILSCGIITALYIQYTKMLSIGFNDITGLKYIFTYLNPVNSPSGEWITILLILLPFPLIIFISYRNIGLERWLLLCPIFSILIASLLTFSRGMYLALVAFSITGSLLLGIYRIIPFRTVMVFNLSITLSICLLALLTPLAKPVMDTIAIFKTTSQMRSIDGRKKLWAQSLNIIKEYPLFGVGSNNFAMHYVYHKDRDENTVFVGRSFNFFLQVLIEKGILGLIAYCTVLIAFFKTAHSRLKTEPNNILLKSTMVLFIATSISILIRDLSYSSILSNKGVGIFFWFMFACIVSLPYVKQNKRCSIM